ncbi:hypothetical protein F8568_000975 [Actinomadura sp. LD22]|uniref:DUF2269 family protein n=1 Tax=Actinomadura physcomitrii TaxID=2650748 RepID=A0A6I4M198_9ACTN|nr:hypothetical protein [Actinomadura physcomitrii]MVZ98979.1 hypothetical protein [Actinomadura physcomitrii]
MAKLFLILHVLAAVIAIGPVAVAASMFPATLRRAQAAPGDAEPLAMLRTLHRICRVYAAVGLAVPAFGFTTASALGVLGDAWVIVSIVLTAIAAAVLVLLVLPAQHGALAAARDVAPGRLAMQTGLFNVLWAAVTIVMIVRPGSTTGV